MPFNRHRRRDSPPLPGPARRAAAAIAAPPHTSPPALAGAQRTGLRRPLKEQVKLVQSKCSNKLVKSNWSINLVQPNWSSRIGRIIMVQFKWSNQLVKSTGPLKLVKSNWSSLCCLAGTRWTGLGPSATLRRRRRRGTATRRAAWGSCSTAARCVCVCVCVLRGGRLDASVFVCKPLHSLRRYRSGMCIKIYVHKDTRAYTLAAPTRSPSSDARRSHTLTEQ